MLRCALEIFFVFLLVAVGIRYALVNVRMMIDTGDLAWDCYTPTIVASAFITMAILVACGIKWHN